MFDVVSALSTTHWLIGGAVVALAALVGLLAGKVMREHKQRAAERREHVLREEVAFKASQSGTWMLEPETEDLSDSAVSSVIEMMRALVKQGDVDMAEKWALNAIKNHKNRVEIPLELAKIYYKSGRRTRFVAIAKYLQDDAFELDATQRRRLDEMGSKIAPDHPLFSPAQTTRSAASA